MSLCPSLCPRCACIIDLVSCFKDSENSMKRWKPSQTWSRWAVAFIVQPLRNTFDIQIFISRLRKVRVTQLFGVLGYFQLFTFCSSAGQFSEIEDIMEGGQRNFLCGAPSIEKKRHLKRQILSPESLSSLPDLQHWFPKLFCQHTPYLKCHTCHVQICSY